MPKWFTCLSCSDPTLCSSDCTEWRDPMSLEPEDDLGVAYHGDDGVPIPQRALSDDQLKSMAENGECELVRETAKRMLARRVRKQLEADEAKARLYEHRQQIDGESRL